MHWHSQNLDERQLIHHQERSLGFLSSCLEYLSQSGAELTSGYLQKVQLSFGSAQRVGIELPAVSRSRCCCDTVLSSQTGGAQFGSYPSAVTITTATIILSCAFFMFEIKNIILFFLTFFWHLHTKWRELAWIFINPSPINFSSCLVFLIPFSLPFQLPSLRFLPRQ